MRRKRYKRTKLRIFTILLVILALMVGGYYAIKENGSEQTPVQESPMINKPSDKSIVGSKNDQNSNLENLVEETFYLSKEGKVPNISFVSGKTEWKLIMSGENRTICRTLLKVGMRNTNVIILQSDMSIRL